MKIFYIIVKDENIYNKSLIFKFEYFLSYSIFMQKL